jgi:hypothetical protein
VSLNATLNFGASGLRARGHAARPAVYAMPALAQPTAAPPAPDALKENFLAEHEIGRRFSLDPAQLPTPKSAPSFRSFRS